MKISVVFGLLLLMLCSCGEQKISTPRRPTHAEITNSYVIGVFKGIEWGDYPHWEFENEKGEEFSFFHLSKFRTATEKGYDFNNLEGKRMKVYWIETNRYFDPPGEFAIIKEIIDFEIIE